MSIVDLITKSDCDFEHSFEYQDTNEMAIDLTGSTLHMMARRTLESNEVAIDLSTENGKITYTLTPTDGKFTIWIPHAVLSRLQPGTYYHSLIRTRIDNILEEVWSGTITHTLGPTR